MMERVTAWRPPTGWNRYPWWSLTHWLSRYLWCLVFGHRTVYELGPERKRFEGSMCHRCSCYMRVCASCDRDITDHVGKRCLYGPGRFTS